MEHEINCMHSDHIMHQLINRPEGCGFSNGDGYIQHDKSTFLTIRNEFLEFCKKYSDHKWIQETIDKGFDADPSWAGRIINECAPSYISKAWYRFQCTDKDCKEWGQPYYATHQDQAKDIKFN